MSLRIGDLTDGDEEEKKKGKRKAASGGGPPIERYSSSPQLLRRRSGTAGGSGGGGGGGGGERSSEEFERRFLRVLDRVHETLERNEARDMENEGREAAREEWRKVAQSAVKCSQENWCFSRLLLGTARGCGNSVVKVWDHGRHVMSSSPVALKTLRVGKRCDRPFAIGAVLDRIHVSGGPVVRIRTPLNDGSSASNFSSVIREKNGGDHLPENHGFD
ncbi:hypothetical protein TNCV_3837111 [Trichonephila clavipes]|nr:hypothetical protein TNCV_3837111 [Trichonephila clavipes]